MTVSQGQTTYNLEMQLGYPGLIADLELAVMKSYPVATGATVTPGQLVMLAADGVSCQPASCTLASGTSLVPQLLGVAALDSQRQPPDASGVIGTGSGNGISGCVYNAGDSVPVLIRGTIFAIQYSTGTTAMPQHTGNGVHIRCSSTTTTFQGMITTDALSQTVGSEIALSPGGLVSKPPAIATVAATQGLVLLEVNFPNTAPTT